MAKRPGRPATGGVKQGWQLFRVMLIVNAFYASRRNGEKYSAAVDDAIAAVRATFPEMPVSATEVKRVLSKTCDEEANVRWDVTRQTSDSEKVTFALGFREIEKFPHPSKRARCGLAA